MNHLVLPDDPAHGLAFYLAAEEFAAEEGSEGGAFFVWSVPPTVIFGRNQDIFSEVNMEYCREHGVDIVRRKSGGGCVYADKGNLMISYITRRGDVQDVFGRYLDRLVEALAGLGIRAERSGRNDVLVDGCKVSGNAFRMLPDRCVVHGTLLYDVDFAAMEKAITPSGVKLASKGVASVRSRVANLKGFLEDAGHGDMDVRALKAWLTDFFCDGETVLSDGQLSEIEEIEKTYREPAFLYGRRPVGSGAAETTRFSGHIPGVGEICLSLVPDGERRISCVHVSGDYFLMDGMSPEMVDRAFTERLRGCPLVEYEIAARLDNMDLGSMIHIINDTMEENLRTCLYDRHIALGAQMSPFGGFDMPIQYTSITEEHQAVRHNAGMFDVSHMGEIFIKGPDAERFVNHIFSNDIAGIPSGKILYGMMLYPDGGVVDDLLVYKEFVPDAYLLVVNASNIAKDCTWITEQAEGYDVTVDNASDSWGEIALQGPDAEKFAVETLGLGEAASLAFYTYFETEWKGERLIVSRTGYTGEDGFEIYGSHKAIVEIWDILLKAGVVPCGLGCRDTLRFEAGLPLYGHELSAEITPLEAGLGMFVKTDKEEFIGKEAIVEQKAAGVTRKIVGIELHDKAIPRADYPVEADGRQIGVVTTGYRSISTDRSVCVAMVEKAYTELGTEVEIRIRKKVFPGTVCKKRFYQTNYKK